MDKAYSDSYRDPQLVTMQGKTVIGFPDVTKTSSVKSLFLNIRDHMRRRMERKREAETLDTSFCSF